MKKLFMLFLTLLPIVASADDSGSCGENVTYTFVEATGTLTISGTGAMTDYTIDSSAPWGSYRSKIKTVDIGDGVTSIGNEAFRGCRSLTSVTIPNSVTSIGNYAFYFCSELTSVIIPNSVTKIGEHAFSLCSELTSINIPNSVMFIGAGAFSECRRLTSITIPNSVTSIDDFTFNNCDRLTSVTIPNSVTSIGIAAFKNCSSLTSVTIPNSVTSIDAWAFKDCSGLTSINVESGNTVYDSRDNCNAIIMTSTNELVVGCKNTVIPNSVTSIGEYAFSGHSGLTSVTIPNSVTNIGSSAFSDCSGLTSVHISDLEAWCKISFGDNPLSCAHHLYLNGKEINDLVIPNGVTSIGDGAFSGCSGLTSVTIPNSVTNIGSSAFSGCSGLTSVTIPNSVTSIGAGAFFRCSGLTSVTIGNSVTSIGNEAFRDCSGLTSVTIGNSVTSIGWCAFYGCSSLTSVTIPNSVTSIGEYAFRDCSGLTSVHISDLEAWCKISFGGYNSNPLTFAHHLYLNGEEIKDFVIPNSVTSISRNAFDGCSGLTSVTIPNSVTSIGWGAFEGCSGLTSVISEIEVPFEIKENVFYANPSIYSTATLTVPHGTKEAYQATSGWNKFENIEEAMGLDPTEGGGTDYGDDSEINNDTNLDGNVVGNIYYNIGNDDGGYSSAEGCIVINTPSADDNIDGKDIFGEDFKDHFTGIVFKIGAGSGTIKVKAETVGSMVLKVKIGDAAPMVMVLNGKLEASFPYSVSEPTNVYIYGGEAASGAPGHRSSGDNALKIYGISWEEEGTSINAPLNDKGEMINDNWYTLDGRKLQGKPTQKGVYINNGAKVVIK